MFSDGVCCFGLAPEHDIWVPVLFYGRKKIDMDNNTKKITTTAMLSAIAYVVVVVGRIPVVLFLKYDPKDIIITLGGLIWGPMTSLKDKCFAFFAFDHTILLILKSDLHGQYLFFRNIVIG